MAHGRLITRQSGETDLNEKLTENASPRIRRIAVHPVPSLDAVADASLHPYGRKNKTSARLTVGAAFVQLTLC